jgi:hypothetical protein
MLNATKTVVEPGRIKRTSFKRLEIRNKFNLISKQANNNTRLIWLIVQLPLTKQRDSIQYRTGFARGQRMETFC